MSKKSVAASKILFFGVDNVYYFLLLVWLHGGVKKNENGALIKDSV